MPYCRNTFRFLLNNLYDFDPAANAVPAAEMEELDLWALAKLAEIVQTATDAYNAYEFHRVYHAVHNFCAVEMSAFYLDVLKDRLYASAADSRERRSAQTAMFALAETLARLLAPILVHTSEEVWDYLKLPNKPQSVHLADLPTPQTADALLVERWEPVLAVRESVKKALEEARQAGTIGNPLEACIELDVDEATYKALLPLEDQLASAFVVSQTLLRPATGAESVTVVARRADGVKCPRCWLIKRDVGSDASHPDLCGRCAAAIS